MWAHVEYFETVMKSTLLTDHFLPDTGSMRAPRALISTAVTEPDCHERVWSELAPLSAPPLHGSGALQGPGLNSVGQGHRERGAYKKIENRAVLEGGKL